MRRQDLRVLDKKLVEWIVLVFCALSVVFLVLVLLGVVDPVAIDSRVLLWSAYGILALIIALAFFTTRTPKIRWKKTSVQTLDKSKFKLEKGKSYMLKDHARGLEIFKDTLSVGVPGLCLTRENPKGLQLEGASIMWLTEVSGENVINPSDLEEITYTVNKFLEKVKTESVVLLDGLEYLISFLGFEKVLHLVQDLRDTMALKGAVLLVPVQAPTLAMTASKLLEKELEVFGA